jgi:hypothetical protein
MGRENANASEMAHKAFRYQATNPAEIIFSFSGTKIPNRYTSPMLIYNCLTQSLLISHYCYVAY